MENFIQAKLVIASGNFGKTLKSFEIVQPPETFKIFNSDSLESLINRVSNAIPSSFSWNPVTDCLRVQTRPKQSQKLLPAIECDADIKNIFFNVTGAEVKLWVYGTWAGQELLSNIPTKPRLPSLRKFTNDLQLDTLDAYDKHYNYQRTLHCTECINRWNSVHPLYPIHRLIPENK